MSHRLVFSIFFVVSLIAVYAAQSSTQQNVTEILAKKKVILDSILNPARYDMEIRPSGKSGPAVVHVNMYIRSISNIDDINMEHRCQITFRQQWTEEKFQFDDNDGAIRYLVMTDTTRIWKPDLFFSNEKEGHIHNIIKPNDLVRIHPNGDVLYSTRISMVFSCYMDLKNYPFDTQTCSIVMASYAYTTEDLLFFWKKEDPVQITRNIHLPRFTLIRYITDYCTSQTNTGEYSCIKVDFQFKRELKDYLLKIYIPCCMMVIVSWTAFWMDANARTARIFIGLATLLTLSLQISWINASLPVVSYTKAIDVWTGSCLTFVFLAFLEYLTINYLSRRKRLVATSEAERMDLDNFGIEPVVKSADQNELDKCEVKLPNVPGCRKGILLFQRRWFQQMSTKISNRLDVVSRFLFPVTFLVFNMCYWITYM